VAYVAGVTHALNAVADGLRLPLEFSPSTRQPILPLPDLAQAPSEVKTVFDEIVRFYALDRPPAVFQWMARDVGFVQSYWAATRQAFTDRALDRLMKEILAFAASMTAKSDYGVDFHLREARRLGLTDQALTEAVEVIQLFNTVTKIADALRLQPDFDPRRSDALGARHPPPS
jgi:AhpD family alkylhydroperoxidase